MRTRFFLILIVLLLASLPSPALAVPQLVLAAHFSGSCSVATGCLIATPTWSTENATVFYSISPPLVAGGAWHYSYTFADGAGGPLAKEISHLLLEISPSITDANFASLFSNLSPSPHADGVESWGDEGNSAPGIPGLLYGLKYEIGAGTATWSFDSLRNPIWGDFYAKDGTNDGQDVYAYNAGFGTDPASSAFGPTGWIPIPDTTTGTPDPRSVPVPGSLWLIGLGAAITLVGRMLRRA